MLSLRSVLFLLAVLAERFTGQSFALSPGSVSVEDGRISNQANDHIYVAAASSLSDCIRLCVDFTKYHQELSFEDCFAYNYNMDQSTCELVHSVTSSNYIVTPETRWKTGWKY